MIVDVHRHVIAGEMTPPAVPGNWRPAMRRENGRYLLTFRVLGGNAGRLPGIPGG